MLYFSSVISVMQSGLLDRLLEIVPSSLKRFSFANSGAEAVENAIKVARAYTGKQNVIAFDVSLVSPSLPGQRYLLE